MLFCVLFDQQITTLVRCFGMCLSQPVLAEICFIGWKIMEALNTNT